MIKANKTHLKLTTPDLVVLSLLSEACMHGYDINQELERREVQDWASVSRPQIYYSLNKLKLLKMITPVRDVKPSAGPDREVFQITAAGKQALKNSLKNEHWATHRPISDFLTWLALSSHADKKTIEHLIQKRKEFLKKELNKEKLTLKAIGNDTGEMITSALLMVDFEIRQFQLELQWLNEVEKKLLHNTNY